MTTATWASGNSHTTDAEFRTWGSEFAAKLAAVGLTQTADTGQINWSTVVRAGVSADAGYEVWRFNDTLQATSPIFIKIYYGTGSSTTTPRMRIELGTGSNGSGTLTGIASGTPFSGNQGFSGAGSASSTNSYMCYNATQGFFGYIWKSGQAAQGMLFLSRTCDATGAPDGDGLLCISYGAQATNSLSFYNERMVRLAATAAVEYALTNNQSTSWSVAFAPAFLTNTTMPNGDRQAYQVWVQIPDIRPLANACVVSQSEFSAGTTFVTAMVGSTTHTFIVGQIGSNCIYGSNSFFFAFLYE